MEVGVELKWRCCDVSNGWECICCVMMSSSLLLLVGQNRFQVSDLLMGYSGISQERVAIVRMPFHGSKA